MESRYLSVQYAWPQHENKIMPEVMFVSVDWTKSNCLNSGCSIVYALCSFVTLNFRCSEAASCRLEVKADKSRWLG